MVEFANEFFWKLLRDFRARASVAGLLLVGVSGVSDHTIILPAWGWALLAIGCAFWIAWRAERKIYDDKHADIKCDSTLAQLITRIVGSSDLFSAGNPHKVGEALLSVAELAHQDRLTVWGRRDVVTSDFGLYPRAKIPGNYWDEFAIDYLEFVRDVRGKTCRARGTLKIIIRESATMYIAHREVVPDVIYSDLYFSRAQIDKLWPVPRQKFRLRSPLHRSGVT
jgi:hypothetical protein